jgi:hypothetical protein
LSQLVLSFSKCFIAGKTCLFEHHSNAILIAIIPDWCVLLVKINSSPIRKLNTCPILETQIVRQSWTRELVFIDDTTYSYS